MVCRAGCVWYAVGLAGRSDSAVVLAGTMPRGSWLVAGWPTGASVLGRAETPSATSLPDASRSACIGAPSQPAATSGDRAGPFATGGPAEPLGFLTAGCG